MEQQALRKKSEGSLYWKIAGTFVFILLLVGLAYIFITAYFANQYFEETNQKLHAEVATHLIQEKFNEEKPFLDDGSINKPLFGDIMHDMMAVNRKIEVYLLDTLGVVKYSVVLDHEAPEADKIKVDLAPIKAFIDSPGETYILGDDPRNPGSEKAFSAAKFHIQGQSGYIYIVLDSEIYDNVSQRILGTYIGRLGTTALMLTLLFAIIIGLLIIWYLTKNLRKIIRTVHEFEDGNLQARIELRSQGELSTLAESFNSMAQTILSNIDEIKRTETLRKELVANISHDLRNPLAIIYGYVETLQIKGGALTEQERNTYIQTILKSLNRLKKLVGELFELSRLESHHIQLKKEQVNVRELLSDIQEKYRMIASKSEIDLEIEGLDQALPNVYADLSLIERVFQNLIDNAIKFTPSGGKISLNITGSQDEVKISVCDTGMGIPEEDLPHLFDRYYTRNRSDKKEQTGTGLGLAIVKKILELHERSIQVKSEIHKGTIFTFSLPSA